MITRAGKSGAFESESSIAILGGGVIGLTTAVVLQALGLRTQLIADRVSWGTGAVLERDFATVHAAASVLPHSVRSPRASQWTKVSSAFLRAMLVEHQPGVRTQHHYEVFERDGVAPPAYAGVLQGFTMLGQDERKLVRTGAEVTSGWRFEAYFCDAPVYLEGLHQMYLDAGGQVVSATRSLDELVDEGYVAVAVCCGHRSPQVLAAAAHLDDPGDDLFVPLEDPFAMRFILGHYVRARVDRHLRGDDGRIVSYNYHPTAEVYAADSGAPADVYCYSRDDAWLLGGSRVPFASLEAGLDWANQGSRLDFLRLPDGFGGSVAVPRQILEINSDLVARFTNGAVDLSACAPDNGELWAGIGLRAERADPADGTRVALSRLRGRKSTVIAHNYGHGGAGFTLSWGCAAEVVEMLANPAALEATGIDPAQLIAGPALVDRIRELARASRTTRSEEQG
jgi:D-amino-acid oxidase